tara:strand:+ start:1286 stop:1483 length:198 start_codon:yes stop_codon:yes gene_type:complete
LGLKRGLRESISNELYNIVKAKITTDNIPTFKAQTRKMVDIAKNEIGTITYDFFLLMKKNEKFVS